MANEIPKTGWRQIWAIVLETVRNWDEDNVSRLAAALSCYMILAIAPLGILSVAIVGAVFGQGAARGQIAAKLGSVVGAEAAQAIEVIILNARAPGSGISSTIFGATVLLFGASGVFVELQSAMNLIWKVAPKAHQGVMTFVRQRFVSFVMVLSVAALLLASLVLGATRAAVGTFFESSLPGGEFVWQVVNASVLPALTVVLLALVFRVVPDAAIAWKDVWLGAFVTALLFTLGKLALGLYIENSSVTSSFSVAGSIVAVVIWVYYSSQIVFFGAELTAVRSRRNARSA